MKHIKTGLVTIALVGLGRAAHAQVNYFPNDATIDYPVLGIAYIGQDSSRNPSSPTVNLVSGGSISDAVYTLNGSQFNISGGSIGGTLNSSDTSLLTITGGSVGNGLQANDHSIVNWHGG